jgi:hypothetical protein
MSKRLTALSLIALLFAGISPVRAGEAGHTIAGAWKVIEVTTPQGIKNSSPQPGIWMFMKSHYSLLIVTGTKARPKFELYRETDAEKIATFDALAANSGTYSVSGSMLTTVPIVSKSEVGIGLVVKYELKFDGADTVSLTTRVGGPRAINTVWKLQRVE